MRAHISYKYRSYMRFLIRPYYDAFGGTSIRATIELIISSILIDISIL